MEKEFPNHRYYHAMNHNFILPVLPLVPRVIREHPEHAHEACEMIRKLPERLRILKKALFHHDMPVVLNMLFFCEGFAKFGYEHFGHIAQSLRESVRQSDPHEIEHTLDLLIHAAQSILAGRESLERIKARCH